MKTSQCPKCGSNKVHSGMDIREKEKIALHTGEGVFGPLHKLDQYVCINCGYVETYLHGVKGLDYVAQHWPLVSQAVD